MNWQPPEYLRVSGEELGRGTPVKVRLRGDQQDVAEDMAGGVLGVVCGWHAAGRAGTLILPVGPVDQFPILAKQINEQKVDCREVVIINMDEYLDEADQWVPLDHPLSFRGFMNRKFYDLVDTKLAPRGECRIFPDPND